MNRLLPILAIGLMFSVSSAVGAATPSAQAVKAAPAIQFDQLGVVKSWRAGGDNVVYVQNSKGQWYKAVLYQTCMKLDTSKGLQFETELNPDTNRKVSKVQVGQHICTVASLMPSSPPPA